MADGGDRVGEPVDQGGVGVGVAGSRAHVITGGGLRAPNDHLIRREPRSKSVAHRIVEASQCQGRQPPKLGNLDLGHAPTTKKPKKLAQDGVDPRGQSPEEGLRSQGAILRAELWGGQEEAMAELLIGTVDRLGQTLRAELVPELRAVDDQIGIPGLVQTGVERGRQCRQLLPAIRRGGNERSDSRTELQQGLERSLGENREVARHDDPGFGGTPTPLAQGGSSSARRRTCRSAP